MKSIVVAFSIGCLGWLGLSFALPSEPADDLHFRVLSGGTTVSSVHPDSHRRGAVRQVEVGLPDWEDRTSAAGSALVMLLD